MPQDSLIQSVRFYTGTIRASDSSKMIASVEGASGYVTAHIPHGGSITTIPKVGETWRYYFTGRDYVLFDRYSYNISADEQRALPGDMIIDVPGNLLIRAQRIDMIDAHGVFFNEVSGKISESRTI